jgi:hypothetical protein
MLVVISFLVFNSVRYEFVKKNKYLIINILDSVDAKIIELS